MKMMMIALAAALVLTGCGSRNVRAAEQGMESMGSALESVGETVAQALDPAATTHQITREQAQRIALEHAGFTADQVTGLHTDYDMEHGYGEYEVEFYQKNQEYTYEIDAETGEILTFQIEND